MIAKRSQRFRPLRKERAICISPVSTCAELTIILEGHAVSVVGVARGFVDLPPSRVCAYAILGGSK